MQPLNKIMYLCISLSVDTLFNNLSFTSKHKRMYKNTIAFAPLPLLWHLPTPSFFLTTKKQKTP